MIRQAASSFGLMIYRPGLYNNAVGLGIDHRLPWNDLAIMSCKGGDLTHNYRSCTEGERPAFGRFLRF